MSYVHRQTFAALTGLPTNNIRTCWRLDLDADVAKPLEAAAGVKEEPLRTDNDGSHRATLETVAIAMLAHPKVTEEGHARQRATRFHSH